MSNAAVERPSPDHIVVNTGLGAHSVPGLLRDTRGWFDGGGAVTVDLAGVSRADSAGVALLLEWWRQARQQGSQIHYRNAPDQMLDIIRFCALEDVLPLA